MIKRQLTIAGIGLAGFALLLTIYLIFLKPMVEKLFDEEKVDIVLLPGERINGRAESAEEISKKRTLSVSKNDRILITERIEKKEEILEIEVGNSFGTYKLLHDVKSGLFFVEGSELTLIDAEKLASFAVETGYLLSMKRVAAENIEDGSELLKDLSKYGLAPEDEPAWFRVKATGNREYRVIIGDKITTGAGYYIMLEGRGAVYIVDSNLEKNVLNDKYSLMQTLITEPVAQSDLMYIDEFKFFRGQKQVIGIDQGEIPEGSSALVKLEMTYPAPYKIESTNYSEVLNYFVGFVGEKVVSTDITEETLQEYGILDYAYRVSFKYKEKLYDVIFSKKDEEGKCYVLSIQFGCIVLLDANGMAFLDWDLIKFVDKPVFMQNINDVSSISINNGKREDIFVLEGIDKDLKVTGNGNILDTSKFRQYYMSILYVEQQGYENPPEAEEPLMLTMTITMRSGDSYVYKFYFRSNSRSYYTIDGWGDFYVLRDKVLKLINDTEKVLSGIDVIPDAPN